MILAADGSCARALEEGRDSWPPCVASALKIIRVLGDRDGSSERRFRGQPRAETLANARVRAREPRHSESVRARLSYMQKISARTTTFPRNGREGTWGPVHKLFVRGCSLPLAGCLR